MPTIEEIRDEWYRQQVIRRRQRNRLWDNTNCKDGNEELDHPQTAGTLNEGLVEEPDDDDAWD